MAKPFTLDRVGQSPQADGCWLYRIDAEALRILKNALEAARRTPNGLVNQLTMQVMTRALDGERVEAPRVRHKAMFVSNLLGAKIRHVDRTACGLPLGPEHQNFSDLSWHYVNCPDCLKKKPE